MRMSCDIRFITPALTLASAACWGAGVLLGGPAGFALSAAGAYFCFPGLHDAAHGSCARWVGHIASVPLLIPFQEFKELHRMHHAHTNDPARDPDSATHRNPLAWILIPEIYVRAWLRIKVPPYRRATGVARYLCILSILALASAALGARCVLARVVLPARAAFVLIVVLLDVLPHVDCPPAPRRAATRNVYVHAPLWFCLLTSGQCYHEMHHARPLIPWYALRSQERSQERTNGTLTD